jgi:hypothetical protein
MALGVEPGDQDSVAKFLATLKSELAEEKAGQGEAQAKVETLAWVVDGLKKTTDRFAAQVPALEEKVKYMDNKFLDGLTKFAPKS